MRPISWRGFDLYERGADMTPDPRWIHEWRPVGSYGGTTLKNLLRSLPAAVLVGVAVCLTTSLGLLGGGVMGLFWLVVMSIIMTGYEDDLRKDPLGAEHRVFGCRYMMTPGRAAACLALALGLLVLVAWSL